MLPRDTRNQEGRAKMQVGVEVKSQRWGLIDMEVLVEKWNGTRGRVTQLQC